MMFFSKRQENIEFFKCLYSDEAFRCAYKYFTEIYTEKDALCNYIEFLKTCETMGFSFFMYAIDDNDGNDENERKIVGFSNFEIKEMPYDLTLDLTLLDKKRTDRYIEKLFERDGYFIVSDNTLKKGSEEEKMFDNMRMSIEKVDIRKTARQIKLIRIK